MDISRCPSLYKRQVTASNVLVSFDYGDHIIPPLRIFTVCIGYTHIMTSLHFLVHVKEVSDNNGGPSSAVDNSLLSPGFDPLDL